jgi:DNA-binding XRE family transcriptional regulator
MPHKPINPKKWKELRTQLGLSQAQLGELLGFHRNSMLRMELSVDDPRHIAVQDVCVIIVKCMLATGTDSPTALLAWCEQHGKRHAA